jgi:hypothetical protein
VQLSENYEQLYRQYRADNPGHYQGCMDHRQVACIADLMAETKAPDLLDYGSGAGRQYLWYRVQAAWGGLLPLMYDPGIPHMDKLPDKPVHGVICTDVLEHVAECDVDPVLEEIWCTLADDGTPTFVYLHIATYPAKKTFRDGRNVHLTVQPSYWWQRRVIAQIKRSSKTPIVRCTYELPSGDYLQPSDMGCLRAESCGSFS